MRILTYTFLGISLLQWLIALAILVLTYGILNLARNIALRRIRRFAERHTSPWNEFVLNEVSRTRAYFLLAMSIYLASLALPLQSGPHELVRVVMEACMLLQIAVWGTVLINYLINDRVVYRAGIDPSTATTMNALSLITRIVLWTVILLILLENVPGIQVTSLITSLGVTGIAVALAVQRILGDLFASLSIALDRPFVLGDLITVDQYQGIVEYIGLKSTRLRSLEGEQLIFSNSDLLNSRIHNYKRMARRRVQFGLRVSLKTPAETLDKIPGLIQETMAGISNVTFDRAHFKAIGAAAYEYEVVYFVEGSRYGLYMDKQQEINLSLLKRFQEAGIELAQA